MSDAKTFFKEYDPQEYPLEKQTTGMVMFNLMTKEDRDKFGKEFDEYFNDARSKGEAVTPFWKYCLERLEVRIKENEQ